MKMVKAWEDPGVQIPAPFEREIRVLLAPDRQDVDELTFNVVTVAAGGGTDLHRHDRPELIYIVSGNGFCVQDGRKVPIQSDVVMWIPAGEDHQILNGGDAPMKMTTIFVPPYPASQIYERCLKAAEEQQ